MHVSLQLMLSYVLFAAGLGLQQPTQTAGLFNKAQQGLGRLGQPTAGLSLGQTSGLSLGGLGAGKNACPINYWTKISYGRLC